MITVVMTTMVPYQEQRRRRRRPWRFLHRQQFLWRLLLLSALILLLFTLLIIKARLERIGSYRWLYLLFKNITIRTTNVAPSRTIGTTSNSGNSYSNDEITSNHKPSSTSNSTKKFPTIETVLEMATLSSLIYGFHTEDYGNDDINNTVCDRINHQNRNRKRKWRSPKNYNLHAMINNRTIPPNIYCEWYHHDWIDGTQVMIVSSTTLSAIDNNHNNNHNNSNSDSNSITIIFGGTDDMTTSLTDVDVLLSSYGYPKDTSNINTTLYPIYNVTLSDPNIRVHMGFDTTLFNARNLFGEIISRVEQIRYRMIMMRRDDSSTSVGKRSTNADKKNDHRHTASASPLSPRIYTTGHSLGGGYSVLMAIGLTQYYENVRRVSHHDIHHNPPHHHTPHHYRIQSDLPIPEEMTVINFGCPQIGNTAFRDYIHTNPVFPTQRLHIYRYVLGWDIVPRLPTLLQHVGHTIQLSTVSNRFLNSVSSYDAAKQHTDTTKITVATSNSNSNITTAAYYHHIGNVTLQYSSVPFGWSATPFIWIPGAVTAHYITAYIQCLSDLQQQLRQQQRGNRHVPIDNNQANDTTATIWITDFERSVPISNRTIYDDDYYIEPPNDDVITTATTAMK